MKSCVEEQQVGKFRREHQDSSALGLRGDTAFTLKRGDGSHSYHVGLLVVARCLADSIFAVLRPTVANGEDFPYDP